MRKPDDRTASLEAMHLRAMPRTALSRTALPRVFGCILAGALVAGSIGCGGSASVRAPQDELQPLPPTPPPVEKTYDYTQRPLKVMTEEQRAEYIEAYDLSDGGLLDAENGPTPPARPGPEFDHSLWAEDATRYQEFVGRRVTSDPRCWTAIGPAYTPFFDVAPYYDRTYDTYYGYPPRRPLTIRNTVLFGTLGGIIGHQYDERDEGILIGAGYGLLLDLMRW